MYRRIGIKKASSYVPRGMLTHLGRDEEDFFHQCLSNLDAPLHSPAKLHCRKSACIVVDRAAIFFFLSTTQSSRLHVSSKVTKAGAIFSTAANTHTHTHFRQVKHTLHQINRPRTARASRVEVSEYAPKRWLIINTNGESSQLTVVLGPWCSYVSEFNSKSVRNHSTGE